MPFYIEIKVQSAFSLESPNNASSALRDSDTIYCQAKYMSGLAIFRHPQMACWKSCRGWSYIATCDTDVGKQVKLRLTMTSRAAERKRKPLFRPLMSLVSHVSSIQQCSAQLPIFQKLAKKSPQLRQDLSRNMICSTVHIGFCDYGLSGQSGFSDRKPLDGPPAVHK